MEKDSWQVNYPKLDILVPRDRYFSTAGHGSDITAHKKAEGEIYAQVNRVIAPRALRAPSASVFVILYW
jgi:hypothetical protein